MSTFSGITTALSGLVAQRYGLVHVDYDTLARTRKNSFHWYADMIAAQPQHL